MFAPQTSATWSDKPRGSWARSVDGCDPFAEGHEVVPFRLARVANVLLFAGPLPAEPFSSAGRFFHEY
jgi:hypothetical protein